MKEQIKAQSKQEEGNIKDKKWVQQNQKQEW